MRRVLGKERRGAAKMSVLSTSVNNYDPGLTDFTHGVDLDRHLASAEIRVQKAWAKGLEAAGFLSESESTILAKGLEAAGHAMANNEFDWRTQDEDIHMNLERFLTETCGEVGKKIHLGRSRNDLIATTLHVAANEFLSTVEQQVLKLIKVCVSQAKHNVDVIIPGMTHMQSGQPIRLAQIYLSYAWSMKSDLEYSQSTRKHIMTTMPLGAAAMAGTTVGLDFKSMATELGFMSPLNNSYYAVGNRDMLADSLYVWSRIATHLSRFCEDMIFYTSGAVRAMNLPEEYSTGSSIMPNKRNPDVFELIRAKTGHTLGALQSVLTNLKGLPTSYNSDLHETKRGFIATYQSLRAQLSIFTKTLGGLSTNPERCNQLLQNGHILATEVANALTENGVPFRDAYKQVATMIKEADSKGVQIHELPGVQGISFEKAIEARSQVGGTAKAQIMEQIKTLSNLIN